MNGRSRILLTTFGTILLSVGVSCAGRPTLSKEACTRIFTGWRADLAQSRAKLVSQVGPHDTSGRTLASNEDSKSRRRLADGKMLKSESREEWMDWAEFRIKRAQRETDALEGDPSRVVARQSLSRAARGLVILLGYAQSGKSGRIFRELDEMKAELDRGQAEGCH